MQPHNSLHRLESFVARYPSRARSRNDATVRKALNGLFDSLPNHDDLAALVAGLDLEAQALARVDLFYQAKCSGDRIAGNDRSNVFRCGRNQHRSQLEPLRKIRDRSRHQRGGHQAMRDTIRKRGVSTRPVAVHMDRIEALDCLSKGVDRRTVNNACERLNDVKRNFLISTLPNERHNTRSVGREGITAVKKELNAITRRLELQCRHHKITCKTSVGRQSRVSRKCRATGGGIDRRGILYRYESSVRARKPKRCHFPGILT